MDRPKPGPNGSSSDDLARARNASQRLRGASSTAPEPEPTYAAFPRTVPPRPSAPLVSRREPLKGPSAGFGPDAWNKLLEACVRVANAEAAFLVDPHGLIIAHRGSRGADELEAVGARLMVAFEQADRISAEHGPKSTLSMSVELPRGTLHGQRLVQPDGVLTLGLIIPGGLTAERQGQLMSLLSAAS